MFPFYNILFICILKHRFAAAESNLSVMFYLISQDHDTYGLLDDKRVCNRKRIRFFILLQQTVDIMFTKPVIEYNVTFFI